MNALDFLRLVLPPENGVRWYVGFAVKKNPNEEKPIRRQWSFRKIEALYDWLVRFDADGFDVYYAVSSFKEEKVWDERDQRWRRRTHDNVDKIADLFADIDTRESKPNAPYADCEEAALAVYKFCRDAHLPVPLWIGSGGGLHTHWPFATLLALDEWLVYARGLKALAKNFGLEIDPVRTADASSILRPPGFHHWKSGRLVQASGLIERFDLQLFEHLKEVGNEQSTRSVARHSDSGSALAKAIRGGLGSDPSDPRVIAQYCGQVQRFAATPGAFSEPSHYGFAGLAHWCGPGGAEWHDSIIDAGYRAAARAKREHWGERYGPPRCSYFHDRQYPELCEACAFFKEGSTPLQLGRLAEKALREIFSTGNEQSHAENGQGSPLGTALRTTEETPALNGFPILQDPWGLNSLSQLIYKTEGNKGIPVEHLVSEHPIYIDHVHTSEATGRSSYTFKHYLPKEDKWTTINVPADEMKNGRGLPELVAKRVLVRDDRLFLQYMNEQLGAFQRAAISHMRYEQFGWKSDDTQFLFHQLYTPDSEPLDVVISDALTNRITRIGLGPRIHGDVRVFTSLLNQLFTPDHYCAWFNILASFGAIFQKWHSGTEGGILISNFTADSAKGKTKILNAAAAIWGMWDALSLKHYDTASSIGLAFAELCNLPVFIDEAAHFATDPKYGIVRLRELIDMFGAGTDKHRALNSGVGIRPQLGRWATHCLTASNRPLYDLIQIFASAETAPLRRLFECDALPPADFDPMLGEHISRILWANSGHAGDAFLRHLMRDNNLDWAKKALEEWTKQIWKSSALPTDHRFRVRLLGGNMLAGELARDCGLIPAALDIPAVIQWGVEQIKTRTPSETQSVSEQGAADVLNQYLTVHANNTLRVQHAYKPGTTQMPLGSRPQELMIRYETVNARLFTAQRDFKKFVVESGYPYDDVIKYLRKFGILKDMRLLTLGAGTEYPSMQVRCMEIDMAHPAFTQAPREVVNVQSRVASSGPSIKTAGNRPAQD